MDTNTLIATAAILFTVMHCIPQVVKIYLSNVPRAISGCSVAFMVFGSLSWALYGFYTALQPVWVAYSFLFFFNVLLFSMMLQKAQVNKVRTGIICMVFILALLGVRVYLPGQYFGYIAAAASVLMTIPQGFKIIRQREATGVSSISYLLLIAASACWLVYGHITENLLLVVPNLIVFPMAVMVYINILKYRAANFWYRILKQPTPNN